jgi:hypothetical protein
VAGSTVTRWIWAAPAVFVVHDGEELATMMPWLRRHRDVLPDIAQSVADVPTRQLALAMLLLLLGLLAAAWDGARRARRGARPTVFLLLAGALAGNGVSHLGQALLFRGYTPGLATALLVVLPYAFGLGRQLESAHMVSARAWAGFVALGIVLQVPIILLTLLLAAA